MITHRALFILLAAILLPAASTIGATNTWASSDGFWARADNWVEGSEPTTNDDVFFDSLIDGGGGLVRLNGGPAGLPFRSAKSITFLDGIGRYTIDGNTGGDKKELLVGSGGISNGSTNLQSFTTQIFLSDSQTWDAQGGDIIADDIVSLGSNTLNITGNNDVTINGSISGNGDLIKDGPGTLTLAASNTFTGDTILNSGTISYSIGRNLAGGLALNGGVLDANNQPLTFSDLTLHGDSTIHLGQDATSQSISFTDAFWNGGTLYIVNWTDTPQSDQIRAQVEPSLEFLSNITFDGFAPGALWVGGPIVPIPEPSAGTLAFLGLLGLVAIRKRF